MDSSPESFKNTIFRRKAPPRTLCLKGCGFLATEANGTLCSQCYKDSLLEGKLSADHDPVSLPAQTQDHPTVPPCSNFLRKRKRNNDDDDDEGVIVNPPPLIVKKRCRSCSKRVGVMGFECRCGEMFCGAHRHPEVHACGFDFKIAGRLALMKQNPVCKADKLRDRV
ncbi:UNVERIFIED_CONTAM: Zinc finger A20 and AN1 domain-containing stress-associated protein 5 [Sesamum latifolium]|uniref:Zinc finger A20 and AN1 domain-containing stress-associated protein 5 n=1 Tax=Sesamum latifolium TaxID=2727402 RepID=A0AAW2TB17_9LAMI